MKLENKVKKESCKKVIVGGLLGMGILALSGLYFMSDSQEEYKPSPQVCFTSQDDYKTECYTMKLIYGGE